MLADAAGKDLDVACGGFRVVFWHGEEVLGYTELAWSLLGEAVGDEEACVRLYRGLDAKFALLSWLLLSSNCVPLSISTSLDTTMICGW